MKGTLATCAVVALLFLPGASAHGASAPRSIDTRILQDDDGSMAYGTPAQADTGALDLLTLDAREARDANGTSYLVLRVAVQATQDTLAGRTVSITFKAGEKDQTLEFHGDGATYNSTTFDRIAGPFPVGDGHPKAIDGWIRYSKLGATPGTKLTEIRVASGVGTQKGDIMPGTWYTAQQQDQPVPHLPTVEPGQVPDPDEVQESVQTPEPGTYTLAGPATLLTLSAPPTTLDLNQGPGSFSLTVGNPLNESDEFVTVKVSGVANASADPPQMSLKAGASKTLAVRFNTPRDATLNVTFASDLGGYASFQVPVKAKTMPPTPTNSTLPSLTPPAKKSPGPWTLLAPTLALAALARRRRTLEVA